MAIPSITVRQPEHHEFRWLDYKAARKLLAPRVEPILDRAHALVAARGAR